MTEHTHLWAADSFHAGIGCMDPACQASGWDWAQDEIKRLTADLEQKEAVVKVVLWQADSYLARARAELPQGEPLWLCETALNHIRDTANRGLEQAQAIISGTRSEWPQTSDSDNDRPAA